MRTVPSLSAVLLVVLFLFPPPCQADDGDSTEGFVPPEERERPIAGSVDLGIERSIGIAAGATGAAVGLGVSVLGLSRVVGSIELGFDSPRLQSGILLTGSGVVISALWTLFMEWHLDSVPARPRDGQE